MRSRSSSRLRNRSLLHSSPEFKVNPLLRPGFSAFSLHQSQFGSVARISPAPKTGRDLSSCIATDFAIASSYSLPPCWARSRSRRALRPPITWGAFARVVFMVLVFMVFTHGLSPAFFLRPASDLHPAPFCGNRRADLARRGLLARPPRLDLLGMELATGVGVRLRLSRFDAALPEAAHPDRGHCFERFADMNADRGLDDNPSRYPTHINIGGNTCRIERTGSRSPVRPR